MENTYSMKSNHSPYICSSFKSCPYCYNSFLLSEDSVGSSLVA